MNTPSKGRLPDQARVVIIGGGAVGVSSLYHLALEGWTDCLLLERKELTAGSTWHAAGNCPNFAGSWAIMNIQRYSMALYRGLAEAVDCPINHHVTGTIRYAHTPERMKEFEHVRAMGDLQGLKMERMSCAQIKAKYPIGETHDLVGSLWDPEDGDIDPAQLTQALAKGARDLGARIVRHCPVTGVTRNGDGWIVHTGQGDVACDYVVNAAGYYAGRVAEWFAPDGRPPLPMTVMSHQFLLTEPIAEIADCTAEHGGKLPMVRDPDVSCYLRQEKTGLNLGPHERNCRSVWTSGDMPEDFSFQLWQEDLDRIEAYTADAMERVPALATAGVSSVINGPIPYTPDGLPLIGPMPGVKNAFDANTFTFTFGIAQAGGAGKVLADWIAKGAPDWDCFAVDPRRFAAWPAAPNMRVSPNHAALAAQGAVFAPGRMGGGDVVCTGRRRHGLGGDADLETCGTVARPCGPRS